MNIPAVCWYDWINLMVVYCLSLWLNFSDEYVICNGCKSPDTILSKENRLFFLRCEQVKYLAKPCRMWGLQFCCDRFPTALGTFRYSRFLTLSMTVFCYTLVIDAIYPIIRVFFCQWWVATWFRVILKDWWEVQFLRQTIPQFIPCIICYQCYHLIFCCSR